MKPDDFENQLQRQRLREIPGEWREEILQAAHAAASPRASRLAPRASFGWREWLWPSPHAWAGLAAVWVIIIGLKATAPAIPGAMVKHPPAPSAETQMTLAAQRREMARLLDVSGETPPAPKPPGPRSEGLSPSKV